MKGMFHKLFGKKENWFLQESDFTEVTKQFTNPARGWYRIYTFAAEKAPDLKELEFCLDRYETLALILIDISSYHNQEIDACGLQNIRTILNFFGTHKKDIILRVVYDSCGKAFEKEPSLYSSVVRHLTQIGELIGEFSHVVFVYQGMLIGNWGEMHASHYLTMEHMRQLIGILNNHKSKYTFLAVRRPMYWRNLHQECGENQMGLFNDGIFGSETDLGTYSMESGEVVGFGNAWTRAEELTFVEKLCEKVPNGGEVVYSEEYMQSLTQEQMLKELRQMHITYLNCKHDIRLLDDWKSCCYNGQGVWKGKSLYDYIGAHLGYRFLVKKVKSIPLKKKADFDLCKIEIEVINMGFSNIYQETEVYLEWTDDAGKDRKEQIACDMRNWNSNSVTVISCVIEAGEGMLYLSAKRKWDNAPIQFANPADEAGRTVLGYLRRDV